MQLASKIGKRTVNYADRMIYLNDYYYFVRCCIISGYRRALEKSEIDNDCSKFCEISLSDYLKFYEELYLDYFKNRKEKDL